MMEVFEGDQVKFEITNNGIADQATHCTYMI